jgi:transposase
MKLIRVGIDLAKNVFQVHGVDRSEKATWRRRLRREEWINVVRDRAEPGCEIGMEACGGAHHWARVLQKLGYRVKLIAPQFVKPYVKSNKNDAADAEAICEAMARPGMRFVPVKTVEQQDIQAVHRVRASLVEQRSAKANQIRGLVAEYGLVAPKELLHLRRALPRWLEDESNGLTTRFRWLLRGLRDELLAFDERIAELDREIEQIAQSEPDAKRLMQLRGVGPIIATAMLATVGDARQFRNGRQMSASLGLTPKHFNSGGKERMLSISKRGDAYLRSLLIHGARAVIRTARPKSDPLSKWVIRLADRGSSELRRTPLTIAKQADRWPTGRTGAGRTRKCPGAQSPSKRLGSGARIAHRGPTPIRSVLQLEAGYT